MPAVQLSKLKSEISDLNWLYTRPDEYRPKLHNLFLRYTNMVYRPGENIKASIQINAYNIPSLVLEKLTISLKPIILENPLAGFRLSDELWQDDVFEIKKVSAIILGLIPGCFQEEIQKKLKQRTIEQDPLPTAAHQDLIFTHGTVTFRREHSEPFMELIKTWLHKEDRERQLMVLRALIPAIQDPNFLYFPPILDIMVNFLKLMNDQLINDTVKVLTELSFRSPVETVYILNQAILLYPSAILHRLARQVSKHLDNSSQEKIKEAIKATQ